MFYSFLTSYEANFLLKLRFELKVENTNQYANFVLSSRSPVTLPQKLYKNIVEEEEKRCWDTFRN